MIFRTTAPVEAQSVIISRTENDINVQCANWIAASPIFVAFNDEKSGGIERYEYSLSPVNFRTTSDSTVTVCVYGPKLTPQIFKSQIQATPELVPMPHIISANYGAPTQTLTVTYTRPQGTVCNLEIADLFGNIVDAPIFLDDIPNNAQGHARATLDLSHCSSGIYAVLLESEDTIVDYQKFIKQ